MANTDGGLTSCRNICWIAGGLLGLVVFLLIGKPWFWALVAGVIVAVAVALLLVRFFCSDMGATTPVAAAPSAPTPTPAPAPAPAAEKAEAPAAAEAAPAETPAEPSSQSASNAPKVKPSTPLPGQEELAERKGDWKYTADGADAPASTPDATPDAPAAAPEAAAPAAAPASDGPDDLKLIKGVGPGIEKKLHAAGVTTFAQIAAWTDADIADMDDKLSFRGRIARDEWVAQAKTLASGAETEFSKRAEDSGLYDKDT